MSKRTRPYEDVDVHQLPKYSRRGLGQSKRVKRKSEAIIADKENIPCFPQAKECKTVPKQEIHRGIPRKTSSVKTKKQPRSRALQPKTNDRSKLLANYPVSQHIAKSDLYNEEGWIGQQQRLFTSILNEVLESQNTKAGPWDEESIRKTAFDFYQADSFQLIVRRLRIAFKMKRLSLINQIHCFRDIGLRFAIKNLLYSTYTYSWLALGLELVTGRTSGPLCKENYHSLLSFIDSFILDHIDTTHDVPDTATRDQISVLKLFILIYVIDALKNILPGPCLFQPNSSVKSSMDVAQRLSKLCLAGEGDINRRLDSITKSQLTHIQYPLDDFDYKIANLAIDLRDGVRLTKVVEILSCRDDCSQQLRWPAHGTSSRIHNLSVALTAAQDEGIKLIMENGESIDACDIESGNREKTLFVLWQLISRWKLPRYFENIYLRQEIKSLRKLLRIRNEKHPEIEIRQFSDKLYIHDLLEWTALVCSIQGKALQNFTTTFINNEPFRCIIDYYFPRNRARFIREHKHYLPEGTKTRLGNPRDLLDMRSIVTVLALLASRVILHNDLTQAAITIQRAFRSFMYKDGNVTLQKTNAAIVIQSAYRRHRKRKDGILLRTAIALQAAARGYLFRLKWRRKILQNAFVGHKRYQWSQ